MDGKSDFDSIGDEEFGELSDGVLSLGNSHTVSWNNNDVFAVDKHLSDLFSISLDVLSVFGDLSFGSGGSPAAEDNVFERSVHGSAHDV